MSYSLLMKLCYLHFLLFDFNFAAFLEKTGNKEGAHVKVVLKEHSPSLIACAQLCLRLNADPVFKDEMCKCVKYEEGASSTDVGINEAYFKQVKKRRNDCKGNFGRNIKRNDLEMHSNVESYKRCRMLCSLHKDCRGWIYVPGDFSYQTERKKCYLKTKFELGDHRQFYYGKPDCE